MRTLFLLLALAAAAAANPLVRVTDTEAVVANPRQLVARGAFEVKGYPHRWFHVYFQVRGPDRKPLRVDGKDYLRKWGAIFTPDATPRPTQWNSVRLGMAFDELEKATNLPRGRTVLWVVCDVWDPAGEGKWIANGWDVACPVEVEVSDAGKITAARPLHTEPRRRATYRAAKRKPARKASLELKHLKLKKGVQVHRCVGLKHTIYDTLWRDWQEGGPGGRIRSTHEQASLRGLQYGQFFETLTTDAQAYELVMLRHRGHAIVQRPGDIIGQDLKEQARPKDWGVRVVAVPGAGWRVNVLAYVPDRQEVVFFRYVVRTDGRLGRKFEVCYTGRAAGLKTIAHPLRLLPDATVIPARVHEIDDYLDPKDWPDHAK